MEFHQIFWLNTYEIWHICSFQGDNQILKISANYLIWLNIYDIMKIAWKFKNEVFWVDLVIL